MKPREVQISVFVLLWTLFFHYQTLRLNYLSPWCKRSFGVELPLVPLLFPPAGWIMFYNIGPSYDFVEVYGIRGKEAVKLDPHDIFATRAVGYDNIHRNVLIGVLTDGAAPPFCRYLKRKFPTYNTFAVLAERYPDLVATPNRFLFQVAYRCE